MRGVRGCAVRGAECVERSWWCWGVHLYGCECGFNAALPQLTHHSHSPSTPTRRSDDRFRDDMVDSSVVQKREPPVGWQEKVRAVLWVRFGRGGGQREEGFPNVSPSLPCDGAPFGCADANCHQTNGHQTDCHQPNCRKPNFHHGYRHQPDCRHPHNSQRLNCRFHYRPNHQACNVCMPCRSSVHASGGQRCQPCAHSRCFVVVYGRARCVHLLSQHWHTCRLPICHPKHCQRDGCG